MFNADELGYEYRPGRELSFANGCFNSVEKSIWKQIVQKKIQNQSRLLNELGLDGEQLKPFYMNVKSGIIKSWGSASARRAAACMGTSLICGEESRNHCLGPPCN